MKSWIKFLSDWTQKGVEGADNVSFKKGDIIELDEKIAKSLIDLGLAEASEEPKDEGLDVLVKGLEERLFKTVETVVSTTMGKIAKSFENSVPNFAIPRDKSAEGLRGFKSIDHFINTVKAVNIAEKSGGRINTDIIGADAPELLIKAPTGQQISNDPEGGFTVPDVMANMIWTNMQEDPTSIMNLAMGFTTAGNSLDVPTIYESSRKAGTGKRHAGLQVYWLDEAETTTLTKATTGKVGMKLHKVGAHVYLTEEIIEDSGFGWESFLRRMVPQAINFELTNAMLHGTGVGKPLGCLRSDAAIGLDIVTRAGAAPTSVGVLHYTVNQMYWRNSNRSRAVWYVHPNVAQLLEFMSFDDATTDKVPVYLPANLTNTPFGTLYGRPVIPFEHMKDLGYEKDMAFIDWSEYGTLTKAGSNGGVRVATSIHVRFLFGEQAIRFTFRVDGRPLAKGTKEDFEGTTTRSPFVFRKSHPSYSGESGI